MGVLWTLLLAVSVVTAAVNGRVALLTGAAPAPEPGPIEALGPDTSVLDGLSPDGLVPDAADGARVLGRAADAGVDGEPSAERRRSHELEAPAEAVPVEGDDPAGDALKDVFRIAFDVLRPLFSERTKPFQLLLLFFELAGDILEGVDDEADVLGLFLPFRLQPQFAPVPLHHAPDDERPERDQQHPRDKYGKDGPGHRRRNPKYQSMISGPWNRVSNVPKAR